MTIRISITRRQGRLTTWVFLFGWILVGLFNPKSVLNATERPNVLIILADDMGFSDLGCYGGEIKTPNLDRLAAEGIRFTQFYNTGRCWPTRGALMTGYYAQAIRRDQVPGIPSGGRGKRPAWAPLLPARLKPFGYRTYHSGKWHLDGMPCQEGFDRSYYLKDDRRYFSPREHFLDDQPLPPVERGAGYYGSTAIASRAINFLEQHHREHAEWPFFLYVAFMAPHFPLHALPEDIEVYQNEYGQGWEAVRAARWDRIRKMGLTQGSLSAVEPEIGPPYYFPDAFEKLGSGEVNRPIEWNRLTPEQRTFQATKMRLHAAMVDRVDREIGRILAQIDAMGVRDNTLVMFLSDNGASAEIMVRGDGHDPAAPPGSADTHLCLGPGWATVSNTPFRRHKTWVHEGGIATPLIAQWPNGIPSAGELRTAPGHVVDLVPTVLQVATGDASPEAGTDVSWHGQGLVEVMAEQKAMPARTLWWLHEGNRALRVGDWKIVASKDESWELYNLATDRTETHNLATEDAPRLKRMADEWERRWSELQALAKDQNH